MYVVTSQFDGCAAVAHWFDRQKDALAAFAELVRDKAIVVEVRYVRSAV